MKRQVTKKDQIDRPAQRAGGANWLAKVVFFFLVVLLLGAFMYALIESGAPSINEMFNEIFRRLLVGVPGLLLIRSGMLVGILLGNFMLYIRQEPRSVEQKNALVGLAKREGLWYAGAVSSLLLAYRWTPFAGHVDIFFILAVAVPLSFIFIFALWVFLLNRGGGIKH